MAFSSQKEIPAICQLAFSNVISNVSLSQLCVFEGLTQKCEICGLNLLFFHSSNVSIILFSIQLVRVQNFEFCLTLQEVLSACSAADAHA